MLNNGDNNSLLYMASNAMRLVLPSFAFGLTFASFEND